MLNKNVILTFSSVLSGALIPLAFAPFHYFVLAILSPFLLLLIWQHVTPKSAFWYGFSYGLGYFSGVYWVYISIHTYGNANWFLAGIIAGILITALALFIACQGLILNYYFSQPTCIKYLVFFPCLWAFMEWMRSWILTGFPWLLLGNSQLASPLRGIAPVLGVYGVSLAVSLTSSSFLVFWLGLRNKKINWIFAGIVIIAALWGGSSLIMNKQWTNSTGKPISVSLIQGNIPQELKWRENSLPYILDLYKNSTYKAWKTSKLIVWPEDAITIMSWQAKPYIDSLAKQAKQMGVTIVAGVPIERRLTGEYYNGMIAFGSYSSTYLKRHLVPFGEYPIWGTITKFFLHLFHIPMSDFTAGPAKQPDFIAADLVIAPSICYEIAYPYETLDFMPKAQILITVSDDSWFGRSVAAEQQLEIARMRSLEVGRYQLVSTNTGITAIIASNGTLQSVAPISVPYILNGKVYAMQGETPWMLFGKYLWLLLIGVGLMVGIYNAGHRNADKSKYV